MKALLESMAACEQTSGMTILQHGEMVRDYFRDLRAGCVWYRWRLPEWTRDSRLWESLPDSRVLEDYHLYHDCGKPQCRTPEGRFPDHAAHSKRVWLEHGGSPEVAELIGMDMDVHLLKAADVPEFAARPQAAALLLTGLAEIHANASMFGGLESTSFKIKWKQIAKRGAQIVELLPDHCRLVGGSQRP